jgi:hypothetical protein
VFKTSRMNKRADFGGWWYVVGLVLGLIALLLIIWIVIQAKSANSGMFDVLGGLFGM